MYTYQNFIETKFFGFYGEAVFGRSRRFLEKMSWFLKILFLLFVVEATIATALFAFCPHKCTDLLRFGFALSVLLPSPA